MAYLSANDFLTGITGGTEDLEINGVGTIQIQALTYLDLQRINRESAGDELKAGFLVAAGGIVTPKLTTEQLEQLQQARPGIVAQIGKRVSALSGMSKETENLAGGGS